MNPVLHPLQGIYVFFSSPFPEMALHGIKPVKMTKGINHKGIYHKPTARNICTLWMEPKKNADGLLVDNSTKFIVNISLHSDLLFLKPYCQTIIFLPAKLLSTFVIGSSLESWTNILNYSSLSNPKSLSAFLDKTRYLYYKDYSLTWFDGNNFTENLKPTLYLNTKFTLISNIMMLISL